MTEASAGPVDVVDLQAEVGNAGHGGPGGVVVRTQDGDQVVGPDGGDVAPRADGSRRRRGCWVRDCD